MRLFSGLILGILLTIGVTFVLDSARPATGPDGSEVKPIVNWEVVQEKCRNASTAIQEGWSRLTGKS
jgi:hypothetical protein